MQTLGIHDVGLPVDASHALHSMLKVLQGRLRSPWQSCGLDRADVLLAHANSDPDVLASWNSTGKPVVLVVDERMPRPTSPFVLRQPIRVMQFMTMLECVADHLTARPLRAGTRDSAWRPLESLRDLMARHSGQGVQMATTADGCCVWMDRGIASAEPATLQRLRRGSLQLGVFDTASTPAPASVVRFAAADLAWFLGLDGPTELAPWLEAGVAYRLRRWPDFGRLGANTTFIELAAIAATYAHTPNRLVQVSGKSRDEVFRFLNAASLAGLVTSAPASAQPGVAAASTSMWSRLVGDLRRHLRLAA